MNTRSNLRDAVYERGRGKNYPSASAIEPEECRTLTMQQITDRFFGGYKAWCREFLHMSDSPGELIDLAMTDAEFIESGAALWAENEILTWLHEHKIPGILKTYFAKVKH